MVKERIMSLEETKKLYHKLVKQGIINKDIQMKEVKKMFHGVSKYNAKGDIKKIYDKRNNK
jgi:hypothetical protein